MKPKSRNRRSAVIFGIYLSIFGLLLILIYVKLPQAGFNVELETEQIKIRVAEKAYQRIPLNNAKYTDNLFSESGLDNLNIFNGSFEPFPNSIIHAERIMDGIIKINVSNNDDECAGTLYNLEDEKVQEITRFIEFYIKIQDSDLTDTIESPPGLIIPFYGKVILDKNPISHVVQESPSITKSGEIRLIGETIFGNKFYKSETHNLNIGNLVRLEGEKDTLVNSYGFIYADHHPGFRVVYKSKAEKARIYTPGPTNKESSYVIEQSLWSRFENDSFFKGLSIFIAVILFYANIIEGTNEADALIERQFQKKKKKKKKKTK